MGKRMDPIVPRAPHPLKRIVEREAFAEIVRLLRPGELGIARLRLEGVPDKIIAQMLGVSQQAVSGRMKRASRRIANQRPWLAPLLRGRQHYTVPSDNGARPLERDWVCHQPVVADGNDLPVVDSGLSTRVVAQRLGVRQATITRWCREGYFPNAYRASDGRGDYVIPESDLEEWE
ncbi:MAG: helix-turn-helix domain-containing protein [Anaerolineae bacterium]